MSLRVVLSEQASVELEAAAAWWMRNRSQEQAARWYVGFSEAIWNLGEAPSQHPLADENDSFPYEIRALHFGLSSRPTHRAVFTVIADSVVVLTVRHAAQAEIIPEDVR